MDGLEDRTATIAADAQELWLEVLNGPARGTTFALQAEETLIGRNPTSDIALHDEGISREHAIVLLELETGEATIEDLQSTNGTKVNGKRIRSAVLCPGDEIQIGHTRFAFGLGDLTFQGRDASS